MTTQARSRPLPATIGAVFGGLWAIIAAMALPAVYRLPAVAAGILISIVVVVLIWRSPRSGASRERLFGKRLYQLAVITEVAAIYLASIALPRLDMQPYFIQVVGIIVGLHFIGLWAATHSRRFIYIAVGMCVVSACAFLLPAMAGDVHARDLVTGAGNALILWFGALADRGAPGRHPDL